MASWIFQAVPDRYDISNQQNLRAGQKIPWLATRYRTDMKVGDRVFFWLGGDRKVRGIYGWGKITEPPFTDESGEPRIPVEVECRLKKHVPVAEISAKPELQKMLILRMAIGTNFPVDDEEAEVLGDLIPEAERPGGSHG